VLDWAIPAASKEKTEIFVILNIHEGNRLCAMNKALSHHPVMLHCKITPNFQKKSKYIFKIPQISLWIAATVKTGQLSYHPRDVCDVRTPSLFRQCESSDSLKVSSSMQHFSYPFSFEHFKKNIDLSAFRNDYLLPTVK